jgi:hypothetical protein
MRSLIIGKIFLFCQDYITHWLAYLCLHILGVTLAIMICNLGPYLLKLFLIFCLSFVALMIIIVLTYHKFTDYTIPRVISTFTRSRQERIKSFKILWGFVFLFLVGFGYKYFNSNSGNTPDLFWSFLALPLYFLFHHITYLSLPAKFEFRKPILILRSFNDSELKLSNSLTTGGFTNGRYIETDSTLEFLTLCFKKLAPCVMYSNSKSEYSEGHQKGSYKFSNRLNWIKKVTEVSSYSIAIIIIPSCSLGIIEELKMLKSKNLLYKTYVLMPPENYAPSFFKKEKVKPIWEKIKLNLKEVEINLPTFNPDGLLFSVKEDFSINKSINLKSSLNNVEGLNCFIDKEKGVALSSVLSN